MLCGDFNGVVRTGNSSSTRQHIERSVRVLCDLLENLDLVDAGTVKNETSEICFTNLQASSNARLDHVYVSASVATMLRRHRTIPVYFLEHCLVSATIGDKA